MKVGFIGLGTMGGNAARNIIRAGFPTVVHDLRRAAAEDHLAMGAIWAESPKDLIDQVDCVVSMVFGPANLEAILKGKGGLLEGDCRDKTWIETIDAPAVRAGQCDRRSDVRMAPKVHREYRRLVTGDRNPEVVFFAKRIYRAFCPARQL